VFAHTASIYAAALIYPSAASSTIAELPPSGGSVPTVEAELLDDFYDARARWLRLLGRQRHLGKSAPILTPGIYWSPRAMGIVCVVLGLAFLLTGIFMT
jgi:hypothetical protein